MEIRPFGPLSRPSSFIPRSLAPLVRSRGVTALPSLAHFATAWASARASVGLAVIERVLADHWRSPSFADVQAADPPASFSGFVSIACFFGRAPAMRSLLAALSLARARRSIDKWQHGGHVRRRPSTLVRQYDTRACPECTCAKVGSVCRATSGRVLDPRLGGVNGPAMLGTAGLLGGRVQCYSNCDPALAV
jgi:hypothetical protein